MQNKLPFALTATLRPFFPQRASSSRSQSPSSPGPPRSIVSSSQTYQPRTPPPSPAVIEKPEPPSPFKSEDKPTSLHVVVDKFEPSFAADTHLGRESALLSTLFLAQELEAKRLSKEGRPKEGETAEGVWVEMNWVERVVVEGEKPWVEFRKTEDERLRWGEGGYLSGSVSVIWICDEERKRKGDR